MARLQTMRKSDEWGGIPTQMSEYNFENDWGVSVIDYGYGGGDGLSELAVLKHGRMHYANPVSCGDVRGWLTDDEVTTLMEQVRSWKPDQTFPEWEEEE